MNNNTDVYSCNIPFSIHNTIIAICCSCYVAYRAYHKRTLTVRGSMMGCIIGCIIILCIGYRGLQLFLFYQFGTIATKYKQHIKCKYDSTIIKSSIRDIPQILAVSIIVVCMSLYYVIVLVDDDDDHNHQHVINYEQYPIQTYITCGIIAHHSCCLADTLASELGMIHPQKKGDDRNRGRGPVLITNPWKHVPVGTNGGVTIMGFIWSAMGGTIIGLFQCIIDYSSNLWISCPSSCQQQQQQELSLSSSSCSGGDYYNNNIKCHFYYAMQIILYATICGLVGSIIDSILGATLQVTYLDPNTGLVHHNNHQKQKLQQKQQSQQKQTGQEESSSFIHISGSDILSNEQVNFVSVAITTYFGGWILGPIIFFTTTSTS